MYWTADSVERSSNSREGVIVDRNATVVIGVACGKMSGRAAVASTETESAR